MLRSFVLSFFVAGFAILAVQGAPTHLLTEDANTKNIITCAICDELVNVTVRGIEDGFTNEEISAIVGDVCLRFNIYTYETCYGTAMIALPTIRYVVTSPGFVEGNFCGLFAQGQDCGFSEPDKIEWTIPPSSVPKPPVVEPAPAPEGSPTLKVLHLADVHWDPDYKAGSLANCGDSLCCRESSGNVTDPADAAGYWGDYRVCDIPWWTVENSVAEMARQHPDVDYIVWTGDLVPHDVYDTDKEENLMVIDRLLSLMLQYFPNTPLYPTLGNHESHPVNTFAPPEITDADFTTSWLYDASDVQWSRWLRPADVSSTVRYGGYYTTLHSRGLRIVSMNNNYCYTYNWWTMLNSQDPASGLAWLNGVLERAEAAGEKVHILSHIPPGNRDCAAVFSREFAKIINRFENTVTAQFYGHTHNEEYKVFYDSVDRTRPVNVAFVAGSLTTYSFLNPGYRVYTVDGDRPDSTYAVQDFTTWVIDLVAANAAGASVDPVWFPLYQAKAEYGLPDLTPRSMDRLFTRMLTDGSLFNLYFKNFYKGVQEVIDEGCDRQCRDKLLCFIVTTDYNDRSRCDQIRAQIE